MITVNKKPIEGVIIKTTDYKENACKIAVLTETGLIDLIVRGAKKINSKLAPLSQPLKRVQLFATFDKKLNTVTEGMIIDNYTNIKENQTKLLVAMSFLESCYYFSKHVLDAKLLYNFFLDSLDYLTKTSYELDLLNYFDIKLWYLLGITPSFNKCMICGKDIANYFSVKDGGNLCADCKTSFSYDEYTSNLLKITFLLKMDKLNEEFLQLISDYRTNFNKIIKSYYLEYYDFTSFNRNLIEKLV